MNVENGYYYVTDKRRPGVVRIIEVTDRCIYDGERMIALADDYEFLGPVPRLFELENLTQAASDGINPCEDQSP